MIEIVDKVGENVLSNNNPSVWLVANCEWK